jgi:hypothetical protein
MHILIPYAAPSGEAIRQVLAQVQLPTLGKLLQLLTPTERLQGSTTDLTPVHQRVLARRLGASGNFQDGLVPWATADAQRLALPHASEAGWAHMTLCHWTVHSDHVHMADPGELAISAVHSDALMDAMRSYFAEDGITLHPLQSGTWLAHGEVFRDLPTAALDRVCNARVDTWMPHEARAKTLRRLQNEMQMLLYTHPVNDERAALGLPAINAFWASGTGTLTKPASSMRSWDDLPTNVAETSAHENAMVEGFAMVPETAWALRGAALKDDPAAWVQAWTALDTHVITELVQRAVNAAPSGSNAAAPPVTLTLCGEHAAATFNLQHTSAWTRLLRRLSPTEPAALLQSL